MKNLKVIDTSILKDWAKEIFTSNNFHMVDVRKNKIHTEKLWPWVKFMLVKKLLN